MICTCGDPTALGVVHLRTRPCFHYVEREWVGLTDEEVQTIWKDATGWGDPSHDDEDLIRAIEAKLRSKNT